MPNAEKLAKKTLYFNKLIDLCLNTPQALLVRVDHVGSKQMQDIRMSLRGKAIVLMGKNTMIRKAQETEDAVSNQAGSSSKGSVTIAASSGSSSAGSTHGGLPS